MKALKVNDLVELFKCCDGFDTITFCGDVDGYTNALKLTSTKHSYSCMLNLEGCDKSDASVGASIQAANAMLSAHANR